MTLHEFTGELLTIDARPPIIIDMMKTTKKVIAGIAIVASFAVGGIAFGQVNVMTYSAQNAGVAIAGFGHCAGFEYRGSVGAFVDVDCAS